MVWWWCVVMAVDPNRTFSKSELAKYDGSNPRAPLYLSIRSRVYDVSSAEHFYGPPNGGYAMLAGKESSRVLALMDFTQLQYTRYDDLDAGQMDTLNDWVVKFDGKYPLVGRYVFGADDKAAPPQPAQAQPNAPTDADGKPKNEECAVM